jgi:hypothetical protein
MIPYVLRMYVGSIRLFMALNRLPELGSNVSVPFSLLRDLLTVNLMHRFLFIIPLPT